jgi:hypothetical protein
VPKVHVFGVAEMARAIAMSFAVQLRRFAPVTVGPPNVRCMQTSPVTVPADAFCAPRTLPSKTPRTGPTQVVIRYTRPLLFMFPSCCGR